jgi:hypothetical protein
MFKPLLAIACSIIRSALRFDAETNGSLISRIDMVLQRDHFRVSIEVRQWPLSR